MPHFGPSPVAQDSHHPALASISPNGKSPALLPAEGDDQARVVVDTVNDNVDRVSRILEERAQAQQAAMDLRELHAARDATKETAADAKAPAKEPANQTAAQKIAAAVAQDDSEASAIEKLAAAVRQGKPIDTIPAPRPAANQGLTAANPADAQAAADPTEPEGDFGDAKPAGMKLRPFADKTSDKNAAGALTNRMEVALDRRGMNAQAPAVSNPMLAIQEQFADRVETDPRDVSAQMDLQLLRLIKGEAVPAMEDLSALPADDRELLTAVCDALANFRSVVKADITPLASDKARPFVDMAERIRARSDLTLSSLTLCEGVKAYGLYDPIEPLSFTAGTPRKSVLYCEVDGFLSQLNGKQLWETKLSLGMKLYDERGMVVHTWPTEPVLDASRKRRRDFFIAKIVSLPPNLRAGHYLLKATVNDVQANRIAESTIQFDVIGK